MAARSEILVRSLLAPLVLVASLALAAVFLAPLRHPVLQWGEWVLLQLMMVVVAHRDGRLQVGIGVLAFELNAVFASSGLPRTLAGPWPYAEATQIYLVALALFALVLLLWPPARQRPFAALAEARGGHHELRVFILLAFGASLLLQALSFDSLADLSVFWLGGSYLEKHTAHKPLLAINQGLLQMIGVACALYFSTRKQAGSGTQRGGLAVGIVFALTLVLLLLYGKRWLLLSPVFTWLLVRTLIQGRGIRLRSALLWAVPFWVLFTLFAQTRAIWTKGDWSSILEVETSPRAAEPDPVAGTEEGSGTLSLKLTQDLLQEGRWKLAYGGTYLEILPLTWATLRGQPYEIIQTRYNRDLFYDEFYAVGGTRAYGFLAEGYANGALAGALLSALALITGLLWLEARLSRLRTLPLLVMGIYGLIYLVFMLRTDFTDCLRSLGMMGVTWALLALLTRVTVALSRQGHQHEHIRAAAQEEGAGRSGRAEVDHEDRT